MENSKLFFDTNVILDMILGRKGMQTIKNILANTPQNNAVISVSSFYTVAYYTEIFLKNQNLQGDQKLSELRTILSDLLDVITVAGAENEVLKRGLDDLAFSDIEDSFQMQTALAAGCKCIITRNIKDFKNSTLLPVLTPEEFHQQN